MQSTTDTAHILVIDDEEMIRESATACLNSFGYEVTVCSNGEEGVEAFKRGSFDIVLTDVKMPGMDGVEVLKQIRKINPEAIVLIFTAYATVETSLEAVALGAEDYLPKPVNFEHLNLIIRRALEKRRLQNASPASTTVRSHCFDLVGSSLRMNEVYRKIDAASANEMTVLLLGETGTGKELTARAIHTAGARRKEPFVAINCGSLPESLLENELFGHVKGGFTGACRDKEGLFVAAGKGTILLDEIEAASAHTQVALLRVLDQRELRPVGGNRSISMEARILVASNRDLEEMVREGEFREDLYYRIAQTTIILPPLRARTEDIPELATHILAEYAAKQTSPPQGQALQCTQRSMECLENYPWPGNVRELRNLLIEAASGIRGSLIAPADLPARFHEAVASGISPLPTLAEVEKEHVLEAMERCNHNKAEAARVLGISRTTIYSLLKKHQV